ncbi:50S ribosomal protein L6 [bacterium]|jgi:large subunit ribosomal protein L6|nr:50S ribosomal protein L6 [bacterium]MBT4121625.1 50S ribosomal protein L6 [bacterium]MBT4335110.1 50S ribosomal protein L6 [bacterium]MBT4495273.1 50S ribosomal protein L6 [bacterium]MBT4763897.1 50S ribosomal protein L6 [bacterium]
MSRIGKKIIELNDKTQIKIENNLIMVKGPKGELSQELIDNVLIDVKDNEATVKVNDETDKKQRALWGLYRSLIFNMVEGVNEGFSKQLEINGVGFKAAVQGKNLVLNLGFSHSIEYNIPEGIDIKVEKNLVTISGIDKQKVGQTAAEIRAFKKPEPYKGKGIKYIDEVIRRKAGKVVKGAEA